MSDKSGLYNRIEYMDIDAFDYFKEAVFVFRNSKPTIGSETLARQLLDYCLLRICGLLEQKIKNMHWYIVGQNICLSRQEIKHSGIITADRLKEILALYGVSVSLASRNSGVNLQVAAQAFEASYNQLSKLNDDYEIKYKDLEPLISYLDDQGYKVSDSELFKDLKPGYNLKKRHLGFLKNKLIDLSKKIEKDNSSGGNHTLWFCGEQKAIWDETYEAIKRGNIIRNYYIADNVYDLSVAEFLGCPLENSLCGLAYNEEGLFKAGLECVIDYRNGIAHNAASQYSESASLNRLCQDRQNVLFCISILIFLDKILTKIFTDYRKREEFNNFYYIP